MKKIKWLVAFLIVANLLLGVIGCKDPEVEHQHQFTKKWEIDEYYHWKKCNCGEIDFESEHSFGDWQVIKAATEEAEGKQERKCTVCPYTATEVIEKLAHTHKFAEEWTKDETNHWHASTCGHEVTEGKAAHSFGDWTITKEPTEEAEGSREKSCTVCEYTVPEVIEKLEHKHKFATDWTKDETHHWYAATCGHTTEVSEKAEHSFGDWTITKEPTEEAEGSREKSCTVCEYTVPEVIEKLEHKHKFASEWTSDETNHWHASTCGHEVTEGKTVHSFGDWTITKEAICTEEGSKTGVCEVCKKEVTEKIDAKGHSYSEIWSKDASGHWHECICGKREDFAEHAYGVWKVQQEPIETQAGRNERTCKDCGYVDSVVLQPAPQGFRFVKGGTITGTESWTPSSGVFVSGRELTIQDLIVSDHEVTRGEYKNVMGSDPSTASAYDKDGNELEGDAVLNNPVNYVSWYDALVYCNKLSMQENLTPCYTIDGSTNPDTWGKVPISSNTTWNAATCDFEANGYRLPTEAEWEWLARGGQEYTYAGSDNVDDVAWYTSNTYDKGTREVKTKAPNGYGLYDMSGNVFEWCWDWYGSVSSSSAADGAASGLLRVRRGGSWYNYGGDRCQVARRGNCDPSGRDGPDGRGSYYGFRVVRPSSK